jgi:hypothetical protein
LKTIVLDYSSIYLALAEVVKDFPSYTFERKPWSENYCTITIPPKPKRHFFPTLEETPKPEIEIYTYIQTWGEEIRKTASFNVKPNYNKTLVKCLNECLESRGFETKMEMQIL